MSARTPARQVSTTVGQGELRQTLAEQSKENANWFTMAAPKKPKAEEVRDQWLGGRAGWPTKSRANSGRVMRRHIQDKQRPADARLKAPGQAGQLGSVQTQLGLDLVLGTSEYSHWIPTSHRRVQFLVMRIPSSTTYSTHLEASGAEREREREKE